MVASPTPSPRVATRKSRAGLRRDISDSSPGLSFALLSFGHRQQTGDSRHQRLWKLCGGDAARGLAQWHRKQAQLLGASAREGRHEALTLYLTENGGRWPRSLQLGLPEAGPCAGDAGTIPPFPKAEKSSPCTLVSKLLAVYTLCS